jgi:hypothetical protein
MQYPAVTMAIRRFAKQLQTNPLSAKKIKRLESMLLVKRRGPCAVSIFPLVS